MLFCRLILICCFFCYTPFLLAQITLIAPLEKKTYQWYLDGQAIIGANSGSYQADVPGTYFATFEESNNCLQESSYFLLADNCNLGNQVKIDITPGCTYEKIEWSNGEIGDTIHVLATKDLTSYVARIDLNEYYTIFRSFQVVQFDTVCCSINHTGNITIVPSN